MSSIFFKSWIFVLLPNPTLPPYLSLNLAFSSQEQSCSCLFRSKCAPSPVCSHGNPCQSPFCALSFSLPIPAASVCHLLGGRTFLSICPCSRPCWHLSHAAASGVPLLFPLALEQNVCVLPSLFPLQDSISNQTAMMDCALETGVGYIPPLTEFIITVFDLLFLSFIFHLNKSSFPLSPP